MLRQERLPMALHGFACDPVPLRVGRASATAEAAGLGLSAPGSPTMTDRRGFIAADLW